MCGGIVGILTFSTPAQSQQTQRTVWKKLPILLSYNSGRILSYVIAGTIVAAASLFLQTLGDGNAILSVFRFIAAALMILFGFYLAGLWSSAILLIEKAGQFIWTRLEPFGKRFLPVTSPPRAFMVGAIWGWLPCGLVYTALIWATTTASMVEGALVMLFFGLGTLPNLLTMGLFSTLLAQQIRKPWLRISAGFLMVGFGLLSLINLTNLANIWQTGQL